MRKNKFTIIKGFKRYNDNFDVKKTHHQIIDYNYYFKFKEFIKIKI